MSNKSWSLGVVIGATMSGSFARTLGGARDQFNSLGRAIKDLSGQRGLIERMEKDQAEVEKARLKLVKAQQEVNRLKLALRKDPSSTGLAKELETAQAAAAKLSSRLDVQRGKLGASQQAMQKAGISVKDYAAQYTRLGQALDQARAKQARMQQTMARRDAAGQSLADQRGQMLGLAGAAYGGAALVGEAMDSQYELRMFGNVANLTDAQLAGVRRQLRGIATDTQQKPGALLEALNTLTAKGLDPDRAVASLGIIGKTATASGADINDLAVTAFTLIDAMGLSPDELPQAMDMLAQAGKAGSFELRDMAQYFPMLTAQAKSLGLGGTEGIASLGAALQIAMKGAADPGTAANNFQNFLAKLTSPDTVKRFEAMGVDIEAAMKEAMAAGKNPIEEMLLLTQELTDGDKFRVGELFGDMQVINFLNPMMQNMEEYRRIKADTLAAKGTVDQDFANISTTSKKQVESFTISLGKLADAFAVTLLPGVNAVMRPLTALAGGVGELIEEFPVIGVVIGGAAVGLLAMKGALLIGTAAVWAFNAALLANPITWVVGAIVAAAALIIHYWEPITEFFAGMWAGIKNLFSEGVGYLTKVWEYSPLGLLFKAGQALAGWVGGDSAGTLALAGAGAGGAATLPAPLQMTGGGGGAMVNAPITIHASPGMNEQDLANAMDRKLREREGRAAAQQRGALYD